MEAFSGDPNFMLSLARGLLVLQAFVAHGPKLTVSEAARVTGAGAGHSQALPLHPGEGRLCPRRGDRLPAGVPFRAAGARLSAGPRAGGCDPGGAGPAARPGR
ncbi:MAG: hypothetical protein WDN45_12265 [Caulobacteraceae bacterium]